MWLVRGSQIQRFRLLPCYSVLGHNIVLKVAKVMEECGTGAVPTAAGSRSRAASSRYQGTELGKALLLSLKDLVDEGSVRREDALEIMEIFDTSMEDVMNSVLENVDEENNTARLEGTLLNFNSYKGQWLIDTKGTLVSNTGTNYPDQQFRICFTEKDKKKK